MIPAVTETSEGMRGVTANLTVTVEYPGSGEVYFSTSPLTEIDMQGAARTAALTAATLLGVDPFSYNYYFSIKADTMIVGGPSAGLAMTIGVMACLLNKTVPSYVSMTGMVNPDATVGPVGGIPEKLEAAAERGVKLFLIPAGQEVSYVERIVKRKLGWLIVYEARREAVNVTELGEKLGVKVVPVATVRQAAEIVLGVNISQPSPYNLSLPEPTAEVVRSWVKELLNMYDELPEKPSSAVQLANEAKRLSSSAPYVAASYAFAALVRATAASYANRLDELMKDASELVEKACNETGRMKAIDVADVEALVAARLRALEAKDALEKAAHYYQEGDYEDALGYAAYAKCRALTALLWLELIGTRTTGMKVSEKDLLTTSSALLSEARSVTSYAAALLKDIGASSSRLDDAFKYLDMAENALRHDDYYGSIGASLAATVSATLAIHEHFTVNSQATLSAVKDECLSTLAMLKDVPSTSLSYLEAAEHTDELLSKLYFYELAAAYARLYLLLMTMGKHATTPQVRPTATAQAPASPKPTTTTTPVHTTTPSNARETPSTTPAAIAEHLPLYLSAPLAGLLVALGVAVIAIAMISLSKPRHKF